MTSKSPNSTVGRNDQDGDEFEPKGIECVEIAGPDEDESPPPQNLFSTTEFTILSRTIILQGWVSDVVFSMSPFFFVHDGI